MNRVHHKHLARRRQSPCRADAAAMLYMLLGLVLAAALARTLPGPASPGPASRSARHLRP